MAPALWLVILPLSAAPFVYLFRWRRAGAMIAVAATFSLAWLALRLPTGVVLNFLGRTIELNRLSQLTLSVLFLATAVLFLIPALLSLAQPEKRRTIGYGKNIGQDVRIFYPSALVALGLFVAASLSRHLGITAIFVELAAILSVFVIQTERLESTRAALRFLILISLATPLLLLAAQQIDFYQLRGGLVSPQYLEQTALFAGVGFAVWLAVFPFHGWLTSTATESSPPMAAFVLITFPMVAFSTLINLLVDLPWLVNSDYLVEAIVIAGVFTAFIGGLLASVQRGFGELLGHTALYDLGCILALLGLGGQGAVLTVLAALFVRTLALVLIATSLSTLHLGVPGDGFAQLRGIARQMPVATSGLLIGGLTLAGVPFTAGFALHWQLLRLITELDGRWAILILLGGLGVAIGYLRGLRAMLASNPDLERRSGWGRGSSLHFGEPFLLLIIIGLLGLISLTLGLFPGLLIDQIQPISTGILFPIR